MNNIIKTLKNLVLNSDSTSMDFYVDIDKIDDYDTVFDAMLNQTEFYGEHDKTYIISEIAINNEKTQLHVKFDDWPTEVKMQHSICEIAEKIFAAKVDLDLNKEDTIALWDKCIKKAITIYFKYGMVKNNYIEFFRKKAYIIENKDKVDTPE